MGSCTPVFSKRTASCQPAACIFRLSLLTAAVLLHQVDVEFGGASVAVDPSPGHVPFHRQSSRRRPQHPGCTCHRRGARRELPLAIHISLATRLQTSSTFCRVAQHIHILTEPPCEALVLGPSLLNPLLLVFLSHCFSESPEQGTGPKQSQRHTSPAPLLLSSATST